MLLTKEIKLFISNKNTIKQKLNLLHNIGIRKIKPFLLDEII